MSERASACKLLTYTFSSEQWPLTAAMSRLVVIFALAVVLGLISAALLVLLPIHHDLSKIRTTGRRTLDSYNVANSSWDVLLLCLVQEVVVVGLFIGAKCTRDGRRRNVLKYLIKLFAALFQVRFIHGTALKILGKMSGGVFYLLMYQLVIIISFLWCILLNWFAGDYEDCNCDLCIMQPCGLARLNHRPIR